MTYKEALDFLFNQLPYYQKSGAVALKPKLENIRLLCAALGNPQDSIKTIHVAGTNGKGSVSHMLAAALQVGGYKTGLLTSPHLKRYNERIKINGNEVEDDYVVQFILNNEAILKEINPSFFEITTAIGFSYFHDNQVDFAVIETGLGGRWDSTNIIQPILSLITNIGFDHMYILGDSLEKIAGEKAGIIKRNIPVLISERQNEVKSVFLDIAHENSSPIYFSGDIIDEVSENGSYSLLNQQNEKVSLNTKNTYKITNSKGVFAALEVLKKAGFINLSNSQIEEGIDHVNEITGFKGRWEVVYEKPKVILDVAHNESGIKAALNELLKEAYDNAHFILGFSDDKDVKKILSLFPESSNFYFTQSSVMRAMPVEKLHILAKEVGYNGKSFNSVNEAISHVKNTAALEKDIILVCGSIFLIAEVDYSLFC